MTEVVITINIFVYMRNSYFVRIYKLRERFLQPRVGHDNTYYKQYITGRNVQGRVYFIEPIHMLTHGLEMNDETYKACK